MIEDAAQAAPDDASPQPGAEQDQRLLGVVEAILFTTDSPLPVGKIASVADVRSQKLIRQAIGRLNERYKQCGSAFRIEEVAGGFQMLTQPEFHDVLGRLLRARSDSKLSQAALETLAVVAYRQPIIRADVESIRGVACGEVLRTLMDKQLVKIVGRAEVLGRPMLYGTTRRFLEVFGLASLEDLPRVEELRSGAKESPAKAQASPPQPSAQQPSADAPPADAPPAQQADPQQPPPATDQATSDQSTS
jgi:segregation and condensation protein B